MARKFQAVSFKNISQGPAGWSSFLRGTLSIKPTPYFLNATRSPAAEFVGIVGIIPIKTLPVCLSIGTQLFWRGLTPQKTARLLPACINPATVRVMGERLDTLTGERLPNVLRKTLFIIANSD